MSDAFPPDFSGFPAWAERFGFTMEGARSRFAQYVVLNSIASVRSLSAALVFKGGNALDFVWQINRSSIDLDFSLDHSRQAFEPDIETIKRLLGQGLAATAPRFDIALAVNSIRQQPPGPDKTFITFTARIGYALPVQGTLKQRMAHGRPSPHVIPVEISLNEPICESTTFALGGNRSLRISTIEDIISEKLRSLLQQPIRDRTREQDVLDIALLLRSHPELDREKIATFLQAKAAARAVPVSKAAFHHPEIRRRASMEYHNLRTLARREYLPFDEAFDIVLAFTDSLPIPDHQPH